MTGYAPIKSAKAKKTKAEQYEAAGYEQFWIVTMAGKTSIGLDTIPDTFDWILDNADVRTISSININRKWRKPEVDFKRLAKVEQKKERRGQKRVIIKERKDETSV